jgi:hypothetical protein
MPPYSEIGTVTLEEELNAKAMDTLERIMTDFEEGRADGSQTMAALQAVHGAVAGCASSDILDLITQASRSIRVEDKNVHVVRQLYHRDGDFLLVGQIVGDDKLLITKHIGQENETKEVKDFMSPREARQSALKIGEILRGKGYRTI